MLVYMMTLMPVVLSILKLFNFCNIK